MNFIPYTSQSLSLEDLQSAMGSLNSQWVTRGPLVEAFEKKCAEYCKAKYAVMFNSGTNALSAASYAVEVKREDTIVTSPVTFVGTVAGALQKTSRLHFCDIDPKTACSNFESLPEPERGRRILFPIHFSGIAKRIKRPENSVIIEDACQAFGSKYKDGSIVGSCPDSDLTVFSFHPAKTLCTGEGGLVTTNSEKYYKLLLLYRNNGIIKDESADPWIYEIHDLTTNCNVTEFQGALGLSQLKKLDYFLRSRQRSVKKYRELLSSIDAIEFLDSSYDPYSSHNLFPVLIDFEKMSISRKEVMEKLRKGGIGTQVHFIPLYRHPYFQKNFSFNPNDYPNTENYYSKALSLPLFSHITEEEIKKVASCLTKICNCQV